MTDVKLKTSGSPADQRSVSARQIAQAVTPRLQELIILPTERCNLRCTYCYEDFAIGRMSEETIAGIERFLENRMEGLDKINFSWFGGEPLVAKDIVLRISKFAKALCDQSGVELYGGFTTNAYLLTSDLFEELISYDQRFFQITLDGWGAQHDELRKFADGRGSFDQIWQNLKSMKSSSGDFSVQLRIHVRRDNLKDIPELIDRLAAEFGADPRFYIDIQHLRNMGGEGGASVVDPLSLTEINDLSKKFQLRYAQKSSALNQEDTSELNNASEIKQSYDVDPYICYAAKPNSLLIRANGRIGKCTVALSDDRNDIGQLNPDGSITVDNDKLRPWLRGLGSFDVNALGCPLHSLPKAKQTQTLDKNKLGAPYVDA